MHRKAIQSLLGIHGVNHIVLWRGFPNEEREIKGGGEKEEGKKERRKASYTVFELSLV